MVKKIIIKENILSSNDLLAEKNRHRLESNQIAGINIMASPGAGKTSIILATIERLKNDFKIGVIEGDVVEIDCQRVARTGVEVVLANTGGSCHLDAMMIKKALKTMNSDKTDLVFVENVGNLICPNNFKLGTHLNVVIASVPEGADKPFKYPGMFQGADVVILNKGDYLDREDFDLNYFKQGLSSLNPEARVFVVSAKTGKGIDDWCLWLKHKVISIKQKMK